MFSFLYDTAVDEMYDITGCKSIMLGMYDPVPHFPSGIWRKKLPLSVKSADERSLSSLVSGPHRYKYFNRPVESLQYSETSAVQEKYCYFTFPLHSTHSALPQLCTIGTQTDYRESETQTDPWNPSYYVRHDSSDPELLTISTLSYGLGLPAGIEEVEKIARARAKKLWEESLPPICGDEKQWKKRQTMLTDWEKEEWNCKINKIKEKQDEQIELMELSMTQEIYVQEQKNMEYLQWLWTTKKAHSAERMAKLRSKLSQNIRRLEKKHFSSSQRVLSIPDKKMKHSHSAVVHKTLELQGKVEALSSGFYLSTEKGLTELENWLLEEGNMSMQPEIYLPKRESRPSRYEKLLQQAHQDIIESKADTLHVAPPDRKFQVERMKFRPPTPSVQPIPQETLDCKCAKVILKSLLHGRAQQKQILECTEKNMDLINELCYIHSIWKEETASVAEMEKYQTALYRKQYQKQEKASVFDEALSVLEGEAVSELLNFLGKEICRHHAERKIYAFTLKAKESRRRKEGEEAGERQQELLRKEITDNIFKQISEFRETAVSKCLNDIISAIIIVNRENSTEVNNQKPPVANYVSKLLQNM